MTQFEFISVAISLVYGLAVSRLLANMLPAFQAPARYWIHTSWMLLVFLMIAMGWWRTWPLGEVTWTGLLFVYTLFNPAILSMQVTALVGTGQTQITSYREQFFASRRIFFALSALNTVKIIFDPWVYGGAEWGDIVPYQSIGLGGLILSLIGVLSASERVHALIIALTAVVVVTGFVMPYT